MAPQGSDWDHIDSIKPPFSSEPIDAARVARDAMIDMDSSASRLAAAAVTSDQFRLAPHDRSEQALEITKVRSGAQAGCVAWLVGDATVFRVDGEFIKARALAVHE